MFPLLILIVSVVVLSNAFIEDIDCPPFEDIKNGRYTREDRRESRFEARIPQLNFRCNPGYGLVGARVIKCKDGNWTEPPPVCVLRKCPDPGYTRFGRRKGKCCSPGSVLTYSCYDDHELVGEPEIMCLFNEVWDHPKPRCRPERYCPEPPLIENGYIVHKWKDDYFIPDDDIQIKCNPGYKLVNGDDFLYCLDDFTWDADFAECKAITCDIPEVPENGRIPELESTNRTGFPSKFEISYLCDPGYRLIGPSWRICGKANWSGDEPYCEEIKCYNPDVPDNGWRIGDSFSIGDKVTFGCSSGFTLIGDEERICMNNGKWSGELARCNAEYNHCPDPGIPINGRKEGTRYNEGDEVTFYCNAGFILIGSATQVCDSNGTWSGSEVFCLGKYDFDDKQEVKLRLQLAIDEVIEEQEDEILKFNDVITMLQTIDEDDAELRQRVIDLNYPGRIVLYFIFDSSGSVGKDNFNSSISFAKALVRRINVTEDGARVGAVVFSSKSKVEFQPVDYFTTEEVLQALDDIPFEGGGTDANSALKEVRENMIPLAQAQLGAKGMKSLVFILTDGKANMGGDPELEAKELKDAGIEIYCIGITGSPKIETLYKIASSETKHVFVLENYKTLNWLVQEIIKGSIDYSVCGLGMQGVTNEKKGKEGRRGRIIGGKKASNAWPWMAALYFKESVFDQFEDSALKCGGSIIADSWILTAAHCMKKKKQDIIPELLLVKLGLIDVTNTTRLQEYEVDNIINHPDFDPATLDYDIALLKLSRPIEYTPYIRPICLPPAKISDASILYKPRKDAYVTGWGHDKRLKLKDETVARTVKHLKQIRMPLQSDDVCNKSIKGYKGYKFTEMMFCAGSGTGDRDACRGDSGGPIMQSVLQEDGSVHWFQIGIISWGVGCGQIDHFGFFTHLSKLRNWIDNEIKQ